MPIHGGTHLPRLIRRAFTVCSALNSFIPGGSAAGPIDIVDRAL